MDPKLRIFARLPSFAQTISTHVYINYRKLREYIATINPSPSPPATAKQPALVYITGFPRTGTTVLKYYFGEYPGLQTTRFDPAGFYIPWKKTKDCPYILVDKSNHYIRAIRNIFKAYGENVAVCCIVRDPRDCFLSLLTFPEAREIHRDRRFWEDWYGQYHTFLSFAREGDLGHRIYFLRYEDFVRHPCEAKHDFLTWLGLDTSLAEITEDYSILHPDESIRDKVHEHRSVKQYALEVWKRADVDAGVQSLIEGWKGNPEAGQLMLKLGYTEEGFSNPLITPTNFQMFRPQQCN